MPSLMLSVAIAAPTAFLGLLSGMGAAQAFGLYVCAGIGVIGVCAIFQLLGDGARPQRRSA